MHAYINLRADVFEKYTFFFIKEIMFCIQSLTAGNKFKRLYNTVKWFANLFLKENKINITNFVIEDLV